MLLQLWTWRQTVRQPYMKVHPSDLNLDCTQAFSSTFLKIPAACLSMNNHRRNINNATQTCCHTCYSVSTTTFHHCSKFKLLAKQQKVMHGQHKQILYDQKTLSYKKHVKRNVWVHKHTWQLICIKTNLQIIFYVVSKQYLRISSFDDMKAIQVETAVHED